MAHLLESGYERRRPAESGQNRTVFLVFVLPRRKSAGAATTHGVYSVLGVAMRQSADRRRLPHPRNVLVSWSGGRDKLALCNFLPWVGPNAKCEPEVRIRYSGATKSHDWMVGALGPLFRTAGHTVRTQHGVTASAGQRRGDVEIRSYLRDQAGSRSLVFDLSIAHDRFGSSSHVQQYGLLSHPQDLDGPMRVAAQRKMTPL